MKNKLFIIFTIISLIMAAASYIATDNYFMLGGVFIIYIVLSILFYIPRLTNFENQCQRFHECYHFISNFIISLSIKKAINAAFENVVLSMDKEFQEMIDRLNNMMEKEKIKYLGDSYFPFHIYKLFLQIIDLYEEEGGDILEMSKYLLQEARNSEEYISTCRNLAKHKYMEISWLWAATLLIIVLLRFTLKDFYVSIKNQPFFLISLGAIFVFIAFSIFLLIKRGTDAKLKGYQNHEKVI